MKRLAISVIVMLLALPAMGQKTDWKKFGELLSEGSYKSAYAEAEAVYKKTKNSTDLLTAAWCMTAAATAYQEDAIGNNTTDFGCCHQDGFRADR